MSGIIYSFEALKFNGICRTIAISLCPLIGQTDGIEPVCYSRNVELSGNIIFQPCKAFSVKSCLYIYICMCMKI